MKRLRILLADDHEVVRRGLRSILHSQKGWKVCAEAASGSAALQLAEQYQPDVAILDISMPELDGLEVTRRIRAESPRTEVLILTVHNSRQVVREVLAAGARGYLLKSDAGRDLVEAVRALSRHEQYLTPLVEQLVLEGYLERSESGSQAEAPASVLTPRERQILRLLANGNSNKEAAALLGVSIKTIETHRANLMRKLGLHKVSDLVRYAVRMRIIDA